MSKKYESAAELEILVQALQQQIQRMQTRMKQEEESYKNKEQHMQAEISKYRHIEEKARGLCVLILGKDRGEMVLGQDYTWNKIDTEGLIEKATTSYKQYCDARKQDLQRIHDFAIGYQEKYQDTLAELEALQQDIDTHGMPKDGTDATATLTGAVNRVYQEKTKKMIQGFEKDNVQYDDEEEEVAAPVIKEGAKMGAQAVTENLMKKADENEKRRLLTTSKPSLSREAKIEREKIDQMTPDVRLIAEKVQADEVEKQVILILGEGICKRPKIVKESGANTANVHRALNRLISQKLVLTEEISYADVSRSRIDYLSLLGKQVYKLISGDYPGEAECVKIKNRHKGYDHGYGIQACLEVLDMTGLYKSKTMFKAPIDLGDGTYFTPDIVAYLKEEYYRGENTVDIFEYECMNQQDLDYASKLNKMALVSDEINIILNNATKMSDMQGIMYQWAQKRKNNPEFKSKYLRLTSFGRFKQKIKAGAPFDDWWIHSGFLDDFPSPEEL